MKTPLRACVLLAAAAIQAAQPSPESPLKPKDVREMAKDGSPAIPKLRALLKNPGVDIRVEAVKAIVQIGTQHSIDALLEATLDADAEVQVRATDGLVNFYLPGYVQSGLSASFRRVGTRIVSKFSDTNDQVLPAYIAVRPDVVPALGKLARGGAGTEVRANAARAVGVLRGNAAIPDLLQALRSKDSSLIYESLVALQKIRDPKVAPQIAFLLRDLDPKVQIAAVETTGMLRNKEALPDLTEVLNRARNPKVRRAALGSMAMIPDSRSRSTYANFLNDKDDGMRASAAEGYARLASAADLPVIQKAYDEEKKTSPRLSLAFALVMLGKEEISEASPLRVLIGALNSSTHRGESSAFLVELTRKPSVRAALYPAMTGGSKDEKIQLAQVLARSGEQDTLAPLDLLTRDANADVSQEALKALRTLKTRI